MEQEKTMECVRCGATAMIDGLLRTDVKFYANENSFVKRLFSIGSRDIKAYACLHCSHLELMVEFTDKDRTLLQHFEGSQPDVLDRIN